MIKILEQVNNHRVSILQDGSFVRLEIEFLDRQSQSFNELVSINTIRMLKDVVDLFLSHQDGTYK